MIHRIHSEVILSAIFKYFSYIKCFLSGFLWKISSFLIWRSVGRWVCTRKMPKKKWRNFLKLSVSKWKLREGVFIFITNSFGKLIIWYSSTELWKRPLYEKTPLFFGHLGDPPSDRASCIKFHSVSRTHCEINFEYIL